MIDNHAFPWNQTSVFKSVSHNPIFKLTVSKLPKLTPTVLILKQGHLKRCLTLVVLYLSGRTDKLVPIRKIEQRPEIKIMWEEQLVDPPVDFITSVNVL